MLIIEIELLIALVLVLIAITRRTAITQWFANRRYQIGLKRARQLFQVLDQKGGQQAITNHLLEEGHFLRSKRRVGDFYCIPGEDIDGEDSPPASSHGSFFRPRTHGYKCTMEVRFLKS